MAGRVDEQQKSIKGRQGVRSLGQCPFAALS